MYFLHRWNFLTKDKDLGLIKLNKTLKFSQNVSPICLPPKTRDENSYLNMLAILIGWGALQFGGLPTDSERQTVVC